MVLAKPQFSNSTANLRFSIRAIILSTTFIGIVLAGWIAGRPQHVAASVQLTSPRLVKAADYYPPDMPYCGLSGPVSRTGYLDARLAVCRVMRSPTFLEKVIHSPPISDLKFIERERDRDVLLRIFEDLTPLLLPDDKTIQFELVRRNYSAEDDRAILAALISAYIDHISESVPAGEFPRVRPAICTVQSP